MNKTSLPPLAPLNSAAVINQRAYQMLYCLDERQFKDLAAFAAYQLAVGHRHSGAARELLLKEGADLLHDVFEDILVGLRDPTCGRHPGPTDVTNMSAFLSYIQKVIRSVRYHQARSAAGRSSRVIAVSDLDDCSAYATIPPEDDAELRDLRDEFFAALRQSLDDPDQYATILEIWHTNFFRIERLMELGLTTNDACKLRDKARRLYLKLTEEAPLPFLEMMELS